MKKNLGVFAFLTILSTTLVSAGPTEGLNQLLEGLKDVIVIIIRFISDMILDINTFDEFLFAKILLLIIIFTVVYTVLKKNEVVGSDGKINGIIAAAISILSIRFLPDNFIQAILLPYNALGIALTVLIPFVIYFIFLYKSDLGPLPRKAGIAIFAISFISLWSLRHEELGNADYIYWGGVIIIIIAFFFDKYIKAEFTMSGFRKTGRENDAERFAEIQERIKKMKENIDEGMPTAVEKNLRRRIKKLEKRQAKLAKGL